MKVLRLLLILVLLVLGLDARAAFMQFNMTNAIGQADTTMIILRPITTPIQANGGFTTAGPAIRIQPDASGYALTNLMPGNWVATNQFLVNSFNGTIGTSSGLIFAVPQDFSTNIYLVVSNVISGGNVFNYSYPTAQWIQALATNFFMGNLNTYSNNLSLYTSNSYFLSTNLTINATNSLFGFIFQNFATTNLLSTTSNALQTGYTSAIQNATNASTAAILSTIAGLASTNYVTGATSVLATITYARSLTNGFVTGTITNGLATSNYIIGLNYTTAAVTNGLATTNYVYGQGFVTATVTNGLATTNYVGSAIAGLASTTITNPLKSAAYHDLNDFQSGTVNGTNWSALATNLMASIAQLNLSSNALFIQINVATNGGASTNYVNGAILTGTNFVYLSSTNYSWQISNILSAFIIGVSNNVTSGGASVSYVTGATNGNYISSSNFTYQTVIASTNKLSGTNSFSVMTWNNPLNSIFGNGLGLQQVKAWSVVDTNIIQITGSSSLGYYNAATGAFTNTATAYYTNISGIWGFFSSGVLNYTNPLGSVTGPYYPAIGGALAFTASFYTILSVQNGAATMPEALTNLAAIYATALTTSGVPYVTATITNLFKQSAYYDTNNWDLANTASASTNNISIVRTNSGPLTVGTFVATNAIVPSVNYTTNSNGLISWVTFIPTNGGTTTFPNAVTNGDTRPINLASSGSITAPSATNNISSATNLWVGGTQVIGWTPAVIYFPGAGDSGTTNGAFLQVAPNVLYTNPIAGYTATNTGTSWVIVNAAGTAQYTLNSDNLTNGIWQQTFGALPVPVTVFGNNVNTRASYFPDAIESPSLTQQIQSNPLFTSGAVFNNTPIVLTAQGQNPAITFSNTFGISGKATMLMDGASWSFTGVPLRPTAGITLQNGSSGNVTYYDWLLMTVGFSLQALSYSGPIADNQLTPNVSLLNQNQIFSGIPTFLNGFTNGANQNFSGTNVFSNVVLQNAVFQGQFPIPGLFRTNGSTTWYISPNGIDTNAVKGDIARPGLNPVNVATNMSTGDTMYFLSGTNYVSIFTINIGQGNTWYQEPGSVIFQPNVGQSSRALIRITDNQTYHNLYIVDTNNNTTDVPIGVGSSDTYAGQLTNIVFWDSRWENSGGTGFHVEPTSAGVTNIGIKLFNSIAKCGRSCIQIQPLTIPNGIVDVNGFEFTVRCTATNLTQGTAKPFACIEVVASGATCNTNIFRNGLCIGYDEDPAGYGRSVSMLRLVAGSATVSNLCILDNVGWIHRGTNANSFDWLCNSSNAVSVMDAASCFYHDGSGRSVTITNLGTWGTNCPVVTHDPNGLVVPGVWCVSSIPGQWSFTTVNPGTTYSRAFVGMFQGNTNNQPTVSVCTNGVGAGGTVAIYPDPLNCDQSFYVTVTPGSGPQANQPMWTNNYGNTYTFPPQASVTLCEPSTNASTLSGFVQTHLVPDTRTTTNSVVYSGTSAPTGTTPVTYRVITSGY